jgi:hypothetical protein
MQVESHLHHVMSHASQLHHVMMQQPSPSFHLILVHLVHSLCSNNQSPTTAVLYRTQIRGCTQKNDNTADHEHVPKNDDMLTLVATTPTERREQKETQASQKRLARHSVHTRYTHTKPLPPSVHRRWP